MPSSPRPEALHEGTWWLRGTRGSNVFAVEANDGSLALIDTGFPQSAPLILEQLAQLGRPLAAILLTHRHFDHAGGAAAVRQATKAPVVAGRGDCRSLDGRLVLKTGVGRTHVARLLAAVVLPPQEPVVVDLPVDGEGEVLPGIVAVPTPGHTPGSLCFLVPRLGAAFVGDLVISHGGVLTRPLRLANADDRLYLRTLAAFAERAPDAGFPGHGAPLLTGFADALKELAAMPRREGLGAFAPDRLLRLAAFGRALLRPRRGSGGGDGRR